MGHGVVNTGTKVFPGPRKNSQTQRDSPRAAQSREGRNAMGLKSMLVKYALKKMAPSLGRYVFTRFGPRFAARGAPYARYSRHAYPPYAFYRAGEYGKRHKSRGVFGMLRRFVKKLT
jgi:hypothetical protein